MSRTANVRFGWIGERWAAREIEARRPGTIVLDLAAGGPVDLVVLPNSTALVPTFVEVKCSRRPSRARNAKLSAAEEEFRLLCEQRNWGYEIWRLHRTGNECVRLP